MWARLRDVIGVGVFNLNKFSFMPFRSGMFQSALGAIWAVAFIVSNAFGGGDSKQKRAVGIVQKTGGQTFLLTEENARQRKFQLSEPATVYLNEKEISLSAVENGRKAAVRYCKRKGQLFAMHIEVFPTHADFALESGANPAVKHESGGEVQPDGSSATPMG